MNIPADLPSRFINDNGVVRDTISLVGSEHPLHELDPALLDFVVRCLNAADSMMRCTGSVSCKHIERDPRGTGIDYGFYVTRTDFDITEEN